MKKAFTLIELIFVIVVIGVLSAVAIPKFSHLTDNSKITAELATASAIQTQLDAINSEWLVNRCKDWTWGFGGTYAELNTKGYPTDLNLSKLVKKATDWTCTSDTCTGPASNPTKGTTHCKADKPCIGKSWRYNSTNGTFTLN